MKNYVNFLYIVASAIKKLIKKKVRNNFLFKLVSITSVTVVCARYDIECQLLLRDKNLTQFMSLENLQYIESKQCKQES